MTTVVNNPGSSGDDGGSGVVVGVVILVVVLFLIFFFGLPYLKGNQTSNQAPQSGGGVQVPSQIDVNVNKNPQ